MIRHIVMWKFKEEAEGCSRLENMEKVRDRLYALVPIIPEIKKMEIGFDVKRTDASADLVLETEFDSLDTLAIYAEHPEHLAVGAFVRAVTNTRVVIDFEI